MQKSPYVGATFEEFAAQTLDVLPPNRALKIDDADDMKEPIQTKQVKSYITSIFLYGCVTGTTN